MQLSVDEMIQAACRWKVDISGSCWIWTGNRLSSGYGRMWLRGKQIRVHRVAFHLAFGPFDDALLVCHHCDNRLCVRPDHLFLGTHADNHADRNGKGRTAAGSRGGRTKLAEDQIREIRRLRSIGVTARKIGEQFSITHQHVLHIANRKSWASLDVDLP